MADSSDNARDDLDLLIRLAVDKLAGKEPTPAEACAAAKAGVRLEFFSERPESPYWSFAEAGRLKYHRFVDAPALRARAEHLEKMAEDETSPPEDDRLPPNADPARTLREEHEDERKRASKVIKEVERRERRHYRDLEKMAEPTEPTEEQRAEAAELRDVAGEMNATAGYYHQRGKEGLDALNLPHNRTNATLPAETNMIVGRDFRDARDAKRDRDRLLRRANRLDPPPVDTTDDMAEFSAEEDYQTLRRHQGDFHPGGLQRSSARLVNRLGVSKESLDLDSAGGEANEAEYLAGLVRGGGTGDDDEVSPHEAGFLTRKMESWGHGDRPETTNMAEPAPQDDPKYRKTMASYRRVLDEAPEGSDAYLLALYEVRRDEAETEDRMKRQRRLRRRDGMEMHAEEEYDLRLDDPWRELHPRERKLAERDAAHRARLRIRESGLIGRGSKNNFLDDAENEEPTLKPRPSDYLPDPDDDYAESGVDLFTAPLRREFARGYAEDEDDPQHFLGDVNPFGYEMRQGIYHARRADAQRNRDEGRLAAAQQIERAAKSGQWDHERDYAEDGDLREQRREAVREAEELGDDYRDLAASQEATGSHAGLARSQARASHETAAAWRARGRAYYGQDFAEEGEDDYDDEELDDEELADAKERSDESMRQRHLTDDAGGHPGYSKHNRPTGRGRGRDYENWLRWKGDEDLRLGTFESGLGHNGFAEEGGMSEEEDQNYLPGELDDAEGLADRIRVNAHLGPLKSQRDYFARREDAVDRQYRLGRTREQPYPHQTRLQRDIEDALYRDRD
jgi:hypothetical protein